MIPISYNVRSLMVRKTTTFATAGGIALVVFVLAAAFIDHEGRLGEYTLTNGTKRTSNYRRPHTYVLFEAFRIEAGKIQQVEAVFITVPYNMPSPWKKH
jgi:hypothetical protein